MHGRTLGGMLALMAVGGFATAAVAESELAERGRIIADTYCSTCHATGETGASPNAEAPPMRGFKERWPVEHLAEALAEGIMVGHPDMPEFAMTTSEIDAFLAYLDSF
jgi:cytochrome c